MGSDAPDDVLRSVRAANFYQAAATANVVLPGDTRPAEVRMRQVAGYLEKARALRPEVRIPEESLGK
jgi:hypothetical protein